MIIPSGSRVNEGVVNSRRMLMMAGLIDQVVYPTVRADG
jgi:hypothetical protein